MLRLEGQGIGQRFNRQWIFRQVNFVLESGDQLLLTGSNGSGKSTFMRIVAGQLQPTEGRIRLSYDKKALHPEDWYRHLSWAGPYMDLYPEFTLREMLKLHFRFREGLLSPGEIMERLQLENHADKELGNFSSGMLHRVKVGLAIFSRSDYLLLDEATTNMDRQNSELIWSLTKEFQQGRMLVWASNKDEEFDRFDMRLNLG